MPEFAYTARDATGQKVSGMISAATEREALHNLGAQSLFPLSVAAEKPTATERWRGGRVRPALLVTTYGQLADLLRSGVPMLRSLEVIRRQTSHKGLAKVLGELKGRVEDGETLWDAMARYRRIFGEMDVNMVRAGGEGAFLEDALDRVATFTEQQEDLKSRTMGAIAYPAFLGVVGTVIVIVLVTFFVPKFAQLFERLRETGELPAVTEGLLWTSDVMRHWGLFIIAGVVAGGFYLHNKLQTDSGMLLRDRVKIRLPGAGKIFLSLAVARFCRVLGTLLQNGVPIIRSLEISSAAAGNRVLALAVSEAAENITAGQSLAAPLSSSGYFPPAVVEMIGVAEESNTLDRVLVDIADGLERRTWRQLDLFVRLLEPCMLLILASIVLVVVVALLLPVIKMSTTIG